MWVWTVPVLWPTLSASILWTVANMKIVVLISISLMTTEAEPLFQCFLAPCRSSSVTCLFQFFARKHFSPHFTPSFCCLHPCCQLCRTLGLKWLEFRRQCSTGSQNPWLLLKILVPCWFLIFSTWPAFFYLKVFGNVLFIPDSLRFHDTPFMGLFAFVGMDPF